jgi:hypothetical protein
VTPPRFRSHDESFAAWLLAVAILVVPTTARAQAGDADGPPPETHAASGAEGAGSLETQEPTLPEDPLALPAPLRRRIGTNADPEAGPVPAPLKRDFYGLYYGEKTDKYQFRTVPPLWAEWKTDPGKPTQDRTSLFGPFYFQRRSKAVDADVLFPLFWNLRNDRTHTTIVGPFMHSERDAAPAGEALPPGQDKPLPGRHDNWLAPLFFEGAADDGSGYLHIPPLLLFSSHTARSGFEMAGPAYCSWRGGPSCDGRTAESIDLGIAPLYFYGRDPSSEYELIPPLLHYYSYEERGEQSTSLWGPLLWKKSRESEGFGVMPFFWHSEGKKDGKETESTTVFPLFHTSREGDANLLVTPLFVKAEGDKGESTFATWGYGRYRGRTELDVWSPLFWWYRDPDIGLDRKLLLPFVYRSTSPREDDTVIFPFYGHFEKPAIRETWWITPFFRHSRDLTGWETDILPIFYSGRENQSTHLVVAPFLWDFASPNGRATVILPAYYRFSDRTSVSQLALNTYYAEHKVKGGTEWEFHFFPAFSYGESPTGHWWNVLYGMAGYSREGTQSKMKALYIPITLSE